MAPPFKKITRDGFAKAVANFNWHPAKSEIHVHHTWRPNHSQYSGLHTINGMYEYHTTPQPDGNGWSDIAQHVSIAPDGAIWTGRPWNRSPASAAGHNHSGVFMFETIGDFDVNKDPFYDEQEESVLFVVASLQIWFDLPLWSSIKFHNQMSSKTCPGSSIDRDSFINKVKEKREELEGHQSELFGSGPVPEGVLPLIEGDGPQAEGVPFNEGEHDHSPELEQFMKQHNTNPFLKNSGPAPEGTSVKEDLTIEIQESVRHLIDNKIEKNEDNDLFVELGLRSQLIEADPSQAGNFQPEHGPVAEGFSDGFAELGGRIFARLEQELHELLCGTSSEDAAERSELREAFNIGSDATTVALVGVLTSGFGVAPAIAVVVAALLLRRVIQPTYQETCKVWAEHRISSQ